MWEIILDYLPHRRGFRFFYFPSLFREMEPPTFLFPYKTNSRVS